MAQGTTSTFGNFRILIGDGATPTEVFSLLCGLTSKGVTFASETTTSEVPDCSDEDAPSFQEKDVKSQSISVSGSGMWTREAHNTVLDWWKSGLRKNIKIQYVTAASGSVEYVNGPAILTNVGNTVEKGGKLSAELSIEFAQMPTFVDKAA